MTLERITDHVESSTQNRSPTEAGITDNAVASDTDRIDILTSQLEHHFSVLGIAHQDQLGFFMMLRQYLDTKRGIITTARDWTVNDIEMIARGLRLGFGKRLRSHDTPAITMDRLHDKICLFLHFVKLACSVLAANKAERSGLVLSYPEEGVRLDTGVFLSSVVRGLVMIAGREDKVTLTQTKTANTDYTFVRLVVENGERLTEASGDQKRAQPDCEAAPRICQQGGAQSTRRNVHDSALQPTAAIDQSISHSFSASTVRRLSKSAVRY